MVKTRIGIKYCGGCNPKYERVEMIQQVQSLVGDRFVFLRQDQQDLDGRIAVNGCPRACAVRDLNQREVPYHSIEEGGFEGLMEWLFTFEQKGLKE